VATTAQPPLPTQPGPAQPSSAPVGSGAQSDLAIGEMLVRMGVLAPPELHEAYARHRQEGRPLTEVLLAGGRITREHLKRAQAARMGIEVYNAADGVDAGSGRTIDSRSMRRYLAVPVRRDPNGALVVAMSDPGNVVAVDDLRMIAGCEIRPVLATDDEIRALLAQSARIDDVVSDLADASETEGRDEVDADISGGTDDTPTVRFVNEMIVRAVDERASDIHFEPQATELVVRFRVDGVLREIVRAPLRTTAGVVSRIKIMSDLDIAERRIPQDGRMGLNVGGRGLDLRVATLPTVHGEKVVVRVLDNANVVLRLEDLGFSKETLARYALCYRRPYGAVFVTGPTGSGKSTTLYGTLNQVNDSERNIITVEDPVEYRLAGINQVQVNNRAGLTFASGLRSILRCDPDVVMIGEVRDRETAQIAIESALTGHLVLATLHTNDSAGALTRLAEMGVEPFLSASAVTGILAQRLARKLCPHCREQIEVSHAVLRDIADTTLLPANLPDPAPVFQAVGCPRCSGAGYKGRLGVYEMLVMSDEVKRLCIEGASSDAILKVARAEGMRTLREDGLMKILQGLTSVEELARAVG
jgi:type IV pilus assembly protein PilB